jgi:hypothetical protein
MRVTEKQLQSIVDRINDITGSPTETYVKDSSGKFTAQIGNYHLSGAYGGWQLQRIVSEGGGVSTITSGFVSKRELAELMWSYIRGLEDSKERNL